MSARYFYPQTLFKVSQALTNAMKSFAIKRDEEGYFPITPRFGLTARSIARGEEPTLSVLPPLPAALINLEEIQCDEEQIGSIAEPRDYMLSCDLVIPEDLGTIHRTAQLVFDYPPLPVTLNYSVNIFVANGNDASQLIEQIFPRFAVPNPTLRIREFDFLDVEHPLVTKCTRCVVNQENAAQGFIIVEMLFEVKTQMLYPITADKPIKVIELNLETNKKTILTKKFSELELPLNLIPETASTSPEPESVPQDSSKTD